MSQVRAARIAPLVPALVGRAQRQLLGPAHSARLGIKFDRERTFLFPQNFSAIRNPSALNTEAFSRVAPIERNATAASAEHAISSAAASAKLFGHRRTAAAVGVESLWAFFFL